MRPTAARFSSLVALAVALGIASHANRACATVLTFDVGTPPPVALPQNYGDRVTAATMGSYSYMRSGGFTPNVVVQFLGDQPSLWDSGFNNLVNVWENGLDNDSELGAMFTADPGYLVRILGFDMGNWAEEVTLYEVSVRDANDVPLFSQTSVVVPDASNPGPLHFDFGPGIAGRTLILRVDAGPSGGSSDNIALDNVKFGQSLAPRVATREGQISPEKQPGSEESTWGAIKGLFR